MRYTESRLTKYGQELLKDINKNIVDFKPNYDQEEEEPTVLGSLLPNLLLNGSSGIAVGMATSIPSHNIHDIYNACYKVIDDTIEGKESDIEEIIKIIGAPDFATGGSIIGLDGVKEGYRTGKGKVIVRGKYNIETNKKGDCSIIITELPYKVNKSNLIETIVNLVRDKKIEGISDIRDESDKDGMRIVIELKRNTNSQLVVNNLIKYTKFQDSFSMNLIAIEDGAPKKLNILNMIEDFLGHSANIILRRTQFDLEKDQKRLNIVDGILKCLSNEEFLANIIHIIRFSEDPIVGLKKLEFNEEQAKYISDMKIRSLSNASKEKLIAEQETLNNNINEYNSIINDEKVLLSKMKSEFKILEDKFGDERRTEILSAEGSLLDEDLVKDETLIITYTTEGTIKAVEEKEYKSQKRGGKGVKATNTKDDELIKFMFTTNSKDDLLFFTDQGKCYGLKAFKIQKSTKAAKGRNINNYISLDVGEKIVSVLNANLKDKEDSLLMITKNGTIKKLALENLSTRFAYTKVIGLKENDVLRQTLLVKEKDTALIVTKKGQSIRINCNTIKPTGRVAMGVKGITLKQDDEVIDMCIITDDDNVLTITDNGFCKLTNASSWKIINRGGSGIIAHNLDNKTGDINSVLTANNYDELFVATEQGIIIRFSTKDIRICGRSSKGVKAIRLNENDKIASVSINRITEEEYLESIKENEIEESTEE